MQYVEDGFGYPLRGYIGYPLPAPVQRVLVMRTPQMALDRSP